MSITLKLRRVCVCVWVGGRDGLGCVWSLTVSLSLCFSLGVMAICVYAGPQLGLSPEKTQKNETEKKRKSFDC